MKAGPRIAVAALLVLLLAAVFASYLGPHMVVDLASRVWSCFCARMRPASLPTGSAAGRR